MKHSLTLTVNGNRYELTVSPRRTLLEVLRSELGLTGTKRGCDTGTCGLCTVLLDGRAALACLVLAVECEGSSVTTIEGLSAPDALHPLQKAFIDSGAVQCGFCTPGVIMTAKALLDEVPRPTKNEIREALAGTLCRCTGHIKTVEAVQAASRPADEEESDGPQE